MTEDNVVHICLCPGCQNMTTMENIVDNTFFCKICREKFRQFKNGKLIYVPLAVADSIKKFQDELLDFKENKDQMDMTFDIEFEPEFEPED